MDAYFEFCITVLFSLTFLTEKLFIVTSITDYNVTMNVQKKIHCLTIIIAIIIDCSYRFILQYFWISMITNRNISQQQYWEMSYWKFNKQPASAARRIVLILNHRQRASVRFSGSDKRLRIIIAWKCFSLCSSSRSFHIPYGIPSGIGHGQPAQLLQQYSVVFVEL